MSASISCLNRYKISDVAALISCLNRKSFSQRKSVMKNQLCCDLKVLLWQKQFEGIELMLAQGWSTVCDAGPTSNQH